jgi:hypothetical protein
MPMRKWQVWALQSLLATTVAVFVGRALARHWDEFRSLDVQLDFGLPQIALAAVSVWVAYALLIEAWRRVIIGWQQSLGYGAAIRIWCVSNLGRYLPGKVWSVAGLAVLAQRAGASGWAATGSALTMQALAVATGASVVAVAAPQAASPLQLAAALGLAIAAVWFLVSTSFTARIVRWVRPAVEWRPLPVGTTILAAVANLLAWVVYGVAFWLLAQGILPDSSLGLRGSVGVFAAGYVVGFLALFAPGGIGIREAVFVALLAPRLGSGEAVALAVGSRLLLTLTEIGEAVLALVLGLGTKEQTVDGT